MAVPTIVNPEDPLIFIAVKFAIRPERADEWLSLVADFTQATRAEEGNIFFEWSRSVDDPTTYVLLEAFQSGEAPSRHVSSEHFKAAMAWMPDVVASTPAILNVEMPGEGWGQMAEVAPRG